MSVADHTTGQQGTVDKIQKRLGLLSTADRVMCAISFGCSNIDEIIERLSFGEVNKPLDKQNCELIPNRSEVQDAINLLKHHDFVSGQPGGAYAATPLGQNYCAI